VAHGGVSCQATVQMSMDHLDGILFLDRVESLVDDVFRRRTYSGGQPTRSGSGPEGRDPAEEAAGLDSGSEKASPADRIG
jgi:hypothetical protein